MDKKLIERMKKNLSRTARLSHLERQLLETVGKKNCEILSETGEWIGCMTSKPFEDGYRYRIRPDYQPEPEVIRCEVYEKEGQQHLRYKSPFNGTIPSLHEALSNSKFIESEWADGTKDCEIRRHKGKGQPAEAPVAVLFAK